MLTSPRPIVLLLVCVLAAGCLNSQLTIMQNSPVSADDDCGTGGEEIPYDGIDNDCDASTPDDDLDGDGYALVDDCDDEDVSISPSQEEMCNERDHDCDGEVKRSGLVSHESDGVWINLSADFTSGTYASPTSIELSDAGVVHVCEGTYYTHLTLSADITVVGTAGAEATVLSGGDVDTVVRVGSGLTVGLSGLTITQGHSSSGGGMRLQTNSYATVSDSVFSNNSANYGGGMTILDESSADVSGTTFENNSADDHGAGMYLYSSSAMVSDSVFSNNFGRIGGGMFIHGSSAEVSSTTFEDNFATSGGGGLYLYEYSDATVSDSVFSNNSVTYYGGGMFIDLYSSADVDGTTFEANSATYSGGGLFFYEYCDATVSDSVFSNNSAASGGGTAIFLNSSVDVSTTSFENNSASAGGGMALDSSSGTDGTDVDFVDNDPDDIDKNGSSYSFGTGESFTCRANHSVCD